ncbi:phosphatase PAP2 family protein [Terasakiispira papahanaumokuakeensis]|nr:phosphatase PAP2 family protein [Terasakiispira papahanaumokuakeensis]
MHSAIIHFWRFHLIYPAITAGCIASLWMLWPLDQITADELYRWQGQQWYFEHHWITQEVIHIGGKWLSIGMGLTVLVGGLLAWRSPEYRHWQRPLAYLFLATASSVLLISLLKGITHLACPWDFSRYGGTIAWINRWHHWQPQGNIRCFPAGHASAGYAWLSLYFVAIGHSKHWRWVGLAIGLSLGLIFGFAQQLRGAHFLSHDLTTAVLCWSVSLIWFRILLWPSSEKPKQEKRVLNQCSSATSSAS